MGEELQESADSPSGISLDVPIAVDSQRDSINIQTRVTSFVAENEEANDVRWGRFLDEVVFPIYEERTLGPLRTIIGEMQGPIHRKQCTSEQIKNWLDRLDALETQHTACWKEIYQYTTGVVGPLLSFTMGSHGHTSQRFVGLLKLWIGNVRNALLRDPSVQEKIDSAYADANDAIKASDMDPVAGANHYITDSTELRRDSYVDALNRINGYNRPIKAAQFERGIRSRFAASIQGIGEAEEFALEVERIDLDDTDMVDSPAVLAELVAELLLNAVKVFILQQKGKNIHIAITGAEDGTLRIDVKDDGPGLPGGWTVDQLFEEGQTGTEELGGTGNGLLLMREAARSELFNGGDLVAIENDGDGLMFTVTIPPKLEG